MLEHVFYVRKGVLDKEENRIVKPHIKGYNFFKYISIS